MPEVEHVVLGFPDGWMGVPILLGALAPAIMLAAFVGNRREALDTVIVVGAVGLVFVARTLGRARLRFLRDRVAVRLWGVWSSEMTLMYRDIEEVEVVRLRPTSALVVKARGETLFLGPFDRMSLLLALEGQLQRAAALLLARRDMLKGE